MNDEDLNEILESHNKEQNEILNKISYEDNEELMQLAFTVAGIQTNMRKIISKYDVLIPVAMSMFIIDGNEKYQEYDRLSYHEKLTGKH